MIDKTGVVVLKPGREKALLRRHPWIFSGAIAQVIGEPDLGDTVEVCNHRGVSLAVGAYSPESQIRVRVWDWKPDFDPASFFIDRISTAIEYRNALPVQSGNLARRLVHAESDGLPGLVVDQYGGTLVVQILSAGPERWRDIILDALVKTTGVEDIYERSDVDVRRLEGLPNRIGKLHGNPPDQVVIEEEGLKFEVNIGSGHKTGFYLDQRANRLWVRALAKGKDVLDCFCYTGGFSVNAIMGGAETVTAVDASSEALVGLQKNWALNQLPVQPLTCVQADIFQQLRRYRDQARAFDLIVLDPPKFAPTIAQVKKAARGYKDINLLALKLLRPGGYLVTFSCSGGVDAALFQKIVADAALDAGVTVRIVANLAQSPDHPVALNFPEGAYLKGLVLALFGKAGFVG
jgi:23S rRNA (cytosine1962-C5)-methyltransferase